MASRSRCQLDELTYDTEILIMENSTIVQPDLQQILQENFDYTLFPWSKQKGLSPIAVKKAEGSYLYDYSGKRYIDFSSGLMNVNIGHGHPRILQAVVEQMQQVSYVTPSCVTEVRGALGEKLASICPGNLNKSLFTVCGATAIENAIKLARIFTGKHKIISRYQSYHGGTYGALAAGGDPRKLAADAQQAPNFIHIDIPILYRWKYSEDDLLQDSVDQLQRMISYEGPDNIAAVLLEGESGTSGCLKYPTHYLKAVRRLCSQHNILLIIDEVMSGFGRTGKWFGFEHHDIVPDMIVTAKGLTSGYLPMGCLVVSDEIAEAFDDKVLPLGLTYAAHPVCCAAALETLKVYEDENLIERASVMGTYLERRIEDLKKIHPSIGDFRNTGLLGCLELIKNRQTHEPLARYNADGVEMKIMNSIAASLKESGMYTFVRWNYIFIAPPLCISESEIEEGLNIISRALLIADKCMEG